MRKKALFSIVCTVLLFTASTGSRGADEGVITDPLPTTPATLPQPVPDAVPVDPVAQAIQTNLMPPVVPIPAPRFAIDTAVLDYYGQRGFRPAWGQDEDVDQLLSGVAAVTADGLDPADFALADLTRARSVLHDAAATSEQRASFDTRATRTYVLAVLELRRGKVDPASLDRQWNVHPGAVDDSGADIKEILDSLDHHQVGQTFASAPPSNPLYTQLRDGLAHLRAVHEHGGWPEVPAGPQLQMGVDDPAVAILRRRLVSGGYLESNNVHSHKFDAPLAAAVKKFQVEQYLPANGRILPETLAALNIPLDQRINQVRVNMERARWLLYKLAETFVVVDIAGYKIAMYQDGKPIWRSRVQVGKPYRSTPVFQSQITYITFNPTWTVPPTILTEDILPKVIKNSGYLAANHIRVFDRQGAEVNPAGVDWPNAHGLTLRQDAGPTNSLGQVVIRFPNPYAIYLHDTPHRELFNKQVRATSSGCIRVEHPLELVRLLFNDTDHWNDSAIQAQLATGKTTNIRLPVKVPVLMAYWTVDLQTGGRVSFKPDVYGHDQPLLRALDKPVPAVSQVGG